MFDLGNGQWIAPEFIVSVVIKTDLDKETAEEWRTSVEVRTTNDTFTFYMPDQPEFIGYPERKGLTFLGYTSPQDFCAKLLAAVKDAKNG